MRITELTKYLTHTLKDVEYLISNEDTINEIIEIIKNSKLIYLCGNGGSSANASHFANDLNKICNISAICLSDNTPILTAFANDIAYREVFSKQINRKFIDIIGKDKVTLIVFSGSGNSKNIIDAVHHAKMLGINVIAFLGMSGGEIKQIKGVKFLHVPTSMLHSEDIHLILCHLIANLIGKYEVE